MEGYALRRTKGSTTTDLHMSTEKLNGRLCNEDVASTFHKDGWGSILHVLSAVRTILVAIYYSFSQTCWYGRCFCLDVLMIIGLSMVCVARFALHSSASLWYGSIAYDSLRSASSNVNQGRYHSWRADTSLTMQWRCLWVRIVEEAEVNSLRLVVSIV